MEVNPLLAVPSPRDIKCVEKCLDSVKYDKLYAKYLEEIVAYTEIRREFLKRTEYTHLVICPDDMLVSSQKIDMLVQDLKEFDFPVLSGWSNNLGRGRGSEIASISKNVPDRKTPRYESYKDEEVRQIKDRFIKVGFSGFPCLFIRRDIVKRIPFSGLDCGSGGLIRGIDVGFANSCKELEIPIVVDTKVHFIHLKGILTNDEIQTLWVGRKPARLILRKSSIISKPKC